MLTEWLKDELEIEVWECLDNVTDPELDEPITDMGFVEAVEVSDARKVEVRFRLPTYWCSPNFAFLMAFGIRKHVAALPWVCEIKVELKDHCFGDEVNEGVNSGRNFADVFAQYCDGASLKEVEEKFLAKAFERRQESVLLALKALGFEAGKLAAMTLERLQNFNFNDGDALRHRQRYLDLLLSRGLAKNPEDPAFPDWEGVAVSAEHFARHMGRLRSTRINMEFNGALCRGLATTRYKEVKVGPEGPSLVDFINGYVSPREGASIT